MTDNTKWIFSLGAITLSWVLILWSTELTAYDDPLNFHLGHFLLRTFLILVSIGVQVKVLQLLSTWEVSNKLKNFGVSILMVTVLITLLEGIFTWIPQSNASEDSLSGRNWFLYYWEANELGYRDPKLPQGDQITEKKNVLVLGDSYVAGHGLKNVEERFSNLLQAKLPDNYRVMNLGRNGATTVDEYQNLTAYPFVPDILILAHVPNDIRVLPKDLVYRGGEKEVQFSKLKGSIFYTHSYFYNFCYLKAKAVFEMLGEKYYADEISKSILKDLENNNMKGRTRFWGNYFDPDMMNDHLSNLNKIVEYCNENEAKMYVVLFLQPFGTLTDNTIDHTIEPLDSFFTSKGIPVLNTYPMLKEVPLDDRYVSYSDKHPSALVNRMVADSLYTGFVKNNFINDPE